ncbi:hypothetical protein D3C75_187560 [compost metagenome]
MYRPEHVGLNVSGLNVLGLNMFDLNVFDLNVFDLNVFGLNLTAPLVFNDRRRLLLLICPSRMAGNPLQAAVMPIPAAAPPSSR